MEAAALPRPGRITNSGLSVPAAVLRLRSDEQLVALFRGGSDEAFCVIHDRYRPRLLAYARQMLGGSHADAEDVLQDVFVRAHAALRSNDAPITLRAWLYRIAHNRCVDGLRRPGPMPAEISPGAQPALSRGAQHDPPVEAERSEDLQRLVRDLLALPEQQRSALLMRELQGLSYDELACSLGVSVGAVKSLLVRARGGVLSAAVARDAACVEICLELTSAHDRGVRPSGQARRHLRECSGCREHRVELRKSSRQLAALAPPAGLLAQLGLIGGGGTGGGLAAAGGGSLLSSGGAAVCSVAAAGKLAALVCAVALVGGAGGAFTHDQKAAKAPAKAAAAPHAKLAVAHHPHHRSAVVTVPAALPSETPITLTSATAACPVDAAAPAQTLGSVTAAAAAIAVATATVSPSTASAGTISASATAGAPGDPSAAQPAGSASATATGASSAPAASAQQDPATAAACPTTAAATPSTSAPPLTASAGASDPATAPAADQAAPTSPPSATESQTSTVAAPTTATAASASLPAAGASAGPSSASTTTGPAATITGGAQAPS